MCLYGGPLQDSYHTRLHPLYREDPGDDRILAGVVLAMFICNPEYLVTNRVFQKESLYGNDEWVCSEQLLRTRSHPSGYRR